MIPKNALVLYRSLPALVTAVGDKYTISYLLPAQKPGRPPEKTEQKVREKDVLILSAEDSTQLSLDRIYAEGESSSDQLIQEIDEAYELLSSDEESLCHPLPLDEIAALCPSCLIERRWALYRILSQDPRFAEVSAGLARADGGTLAAFSLRPIEEVKKLSEKQEAKRREEGERTDFISRLRARRIHADADARFLQEIEALALGNTERSRLLKEAGITETAENAHRILLESGFWDITRNPHPLRRRLSLHSPEEPVDEPPDEERLTLSHTAYAIDNEWSSDPDDAIAFDGEYLWVHVADPAASVHAESRADRAARARGTTLYLPEGTVRMLEESSLGYYALGLSSSSRALSFRIALDENGAVSSCQIYKTLVQVSRLTYAEAEAKKHTPELKPLFDIARRNIERREQKGAVFIELPEVHITVSEGQVSIEPVIHNEASDTVREAMLLAGEAAARFAFKHGIPFPYVSQEEPDIPRDPLSGLAGQYRLRRCMRSRSVGVVPSSHSGLGLGMYSQVTSPLRRYGDLAAHQQLRAFLDGRPGDDTDRLLERIAAGDAAAADSVRAERESRLHWILVYLLQHPDWTGEAIAVEQRGKQYVCLIPSLAHETLITPQKHLSLNEKIRVRAGNIHIHTLSVSFMETESG